MSKPIVLWTAEAKEDLIRIWKNYPQHHEELAWIRPALEHRLERDPEGFALEVRPDGSAVGIEPELPLDEGANIAIGVEYVVTERRVFRAWIYIKPNRHRDDA